MTRTNYAEADRILTFLTPDFGKVKAIAKAVRNNNSKLAGSVELFCVSEIAYVVGKGEINTLTGSRLIKHYGKILESLDRTSRAYKIMRIINKATEDAAEKGYFQLLEAVFAALDDNEIDSELTEFWFKMQLLSLSGHAPNLQTDLDGKKLIAAETYNFYLDKMRFAPKKTKQGRFSEKHIKILRISLAAQNPRVMNRIEGSQKLIQKVEPMVETMLNSFIPI